MFAHHENNDSLFQANYKNILLVDEANLKFYNVHCLRIEKSLI